MITLQSGHTPSIATLRSTAWHALHVQCDHSEYWSDRYARDAAPFEWYRGYEDLAPVLNRTVAKTARVLHAGVGTSTLHESMADDGYQHIENVDYSAEAIACVQRRWQEWCALGQMRGGCGGCLRAREAAVGAAPSAAFGTRRPRPLGIAEPWCRVPHARTAA